MTACLSSLLSLHLLQPLLPEKHACRHRIVTDRTHHSRSPDIPGHLMFSMRPWANCCVWLGWTSAITRLLSCSCSTGTEAMPSISALTQGKATLAPSLSRCLSLYSSTNSPPFKSSTVRCFALFFSYTRDISQASSCSKASLRTHLPNSRRGRPLLLFRHWHLHLLLQSCHTS